MVWLQLKGEQLSGSAYYFNGCKALKFSSVVHFNHATRQLSTWVKAIDSSVGSQDDWGSSCSGPRSRCCYPKVFCMRRTGFQKKKPCSKLNSAVARESQTWPGEKRKKKKEKLLKDARFCKSEGEKRQMFNFLQCASGRAERCGFVGR